MLGALLQNYINAIKTADFVSNLVVKHPPVEKKEFDHSNKTSMICVYVFAKSLLLFSHHLNFSKKHDYTPSSSKEAPHACLYDVDSFLVDHCQLKTHNI